MSTHRLSASGERQYTITAGGGAFTAAQFNSKPGDRVNAQIGQVGEIAIALPASGVRIERWRSKRGYEMLVLRAEGKLWEPEGGEPMRNPISINVHGIPSGQNHPLTNVDVRRDDESDPLRLTLGDDAELVETTEVTITPTEES